MAGIYTQRRDIPISGGSTILVTDLNGNVDTKWDIASSIHASQVTTSFRSGKGEALVSPHELSDTNTYLNNLLQTKTVTYDTGHEFSTIKREAFILMPNSRYVVGKRIYNIPFVTLPMWKGIEDSDFPSIPKWDSRDVDGNNAILHTYPTAPVASLSQALIELKREGLPNLFGAQIASMKGGAARAIGGEYLNSVFGWTPLIKDLEKLLKAVVESSKIIQQLQKDSGKLVRRKYSFPMDRKMGTNITTTAAARALPSDGSPFYGQTGNLTISETTTTTKWFSGQYTYFLDPGETLVGKAIMYEQLANKLLGLRITPDVLWNLAPWSWLSDWFVNIGNNITVASAFQQDGLTLKYGYLMRKVVAERMYSFSPIGPIQGQTPATSYMILRTTSKERVKSSPFGFGVSPDSFTSRQWAIAGSLGLTKAPRSIR